MLLLFAGDGGGEAREDEKRAYSEGSLFYYWTLGGCFAFWYT